MKPTTELPQDFRDGAMLLVNKPLDWTSFDVVNKIRYKIKCKIGHAGTLDPRATGLLILCTGKFTKRIDEFSVLDKSYDGLMQFGAKTESFDTETEPYDIKQTESLTQETIERELVNFNGTITQIPPKYSAIKQNGVPLYKLARAGVEIKEIRSREVDISNFHVSLLEKGLASFSVDCSKGTYIRSLVNDLGENIGIGAYLKELRRTRIGSFDLKDAWELDDLVATLNDYVPKS